MGDQFYEKQSESKSWNTKLERYHKLLENGPRYFLRWKVFGKQNEAIFFQINNPSTRVFSFESSRVGSRKFVVADIDDFWDHYKTLSKKHFYEVIQEGLACRLYFDIEFEFEINIDSDADEMMAIFTRFIIARCKSNFCVDLSPKNFIELDSTTKTKFSRHLVVHIPGFIFKDNHQVGIFVTSLINELNMIKATKSVPQDLNIELSDLLKLFIKNKQNESTTFVDTSVYSKNRNFRIVLSSKLKKNTALDSLSGTIWTRESFKRTLVCENSNSVFQNIIDYNRIISNKKASSNKQVAMTKSSKESKFPQLDLYLVQFLRQFGDTCVFIRSVIFFEDCEYLLTLANTLVYSLGNHRYCHRIGKSHKSNGVYYVLDLAKGIFYQKCYDPDCVHFQSQDYHIPPAVNPFSLNDDEFAEISDTDVLDIPDSLLVDDAETPN